MHWHFLRKIQLEDNMFTESHNFTNINQNFNMKTIKRILILIAVIICCLCEKESHWLCHTYGGIYETTRITLEFSEDRTECEVTERDNAGGY